MRNTNAGSRFLYDHTILSILTALASVVKISSSLKWCCERDIERSGAEICQICQLPSTRHPCLRHAAALFQPWTEL